MQPLKSFTDAGSSRFRGVYLMLASQLPPEQAKELRDTLVDRAAETKDHILSDSVVEILTIILKRSAAGRVGASLQRDASIAVA